MWIRTPSNHARVSAVALAFALALLPAVARSDGDAMAPYRERFATGYEKYRGGAFGDALAYWEPIYRELGPEQGYRLSWNIARAYDALGEATRAAERYSAFLEVARRRRARGEALEEIVGREEAQAHARLDALGASHGRLKIAARTPPSSVQIDGGEPRLAGFVAYVAPGAHVVVFDPATKDTARRELTVQAGQEMEVAPPEPVEVVPAPPPAPALLPPRVVREVVRVERPFGAGWLFVAGAVTAAAVAVPIAGYVNAQGALDALRASQNNQDDFRRQSELAGAYNAARAGAYATLAVPFVLAGATGGLALVWLGASRRSVVLVPQVDGAALGGAF